MKNGLLYDRFGFSFGGGDYLPLMFIAALQKTCNLTVAVDMACNLERSAKTFGIDIDLPKLKVVQVTPPDYSPKKHNVFLSLYRFRRLKRLAKEADVCLSASSIMDFGRPAHQFINMIAFGDPAFSAFAQNRGGPVRERLSTKVKRFLSDSVLRPLLGMRSKRDIICDRRERIYPNSRFVEKLMTSFYGPFNSTLFYPPTLFEAESSVLARDPLKVVYIGRIIPEKRLEEIIGIVERARVLSGLDLTFQAAGRLDQTPSYGKKLSQMAEERTWLKFTGALYGEEKKRFLLSGSYALHAERDEAFGISVTEYLSSGLIPIVPDEGGTPEIVNSPELTYHAPEDAAQILAHLLVDAAFREKMQRHCVLRAQLFSRTSYLKRQQELLGHLLEST